MRVLAFPHGTTIMLVAALACATCAMLPVRAENSNNNNNNKDTTPTSGNDGTENNSTTTFAPLQPVTAGYANHMRHYFDFFFVFYQSTFSSCRRTYEDFCLPALNQAWFTNSELKQKWEAQDMKCLSTYCNCWPGGTLVQRISRGQEYYTCNVPPSLTAKELCVAEEYCAAANYVCFMDWIYGHNGSMSGLPAGCSTFLQCTEQPAVVNDTLTSCLAKPPTQTIQGGQYCSMDRTCSFTQSQVNGNVTVKRLLGDAASKEATLGALKKKNNAFSDASSVHTIMLVTGLLVLFSFIFIGYAYVRYRGQYRLSEAAVSAARLTNEELRLESVQVAKWYGAPLVVPVSGSDSMSLSPNVVCAFCGTGSPKYLMLPCRCRWCGCKASAGNMKDVTSGGKKKGSDKKEKGEEEKESEGSSATAPAVASPVPLERPTRCDPKHCGSHVEEVIDFSPFEHNTSTVLSASSASPSNNATKEGKSEEDKSRDETAANNGAGGGEDTGGEDASCVICLDSKAIVAFFPCSHRATCGSCGKRIVEGDAVARQTQVLNYAEGKKTTAVCPLCRAEINFAVVLEADMDAVAYQDTLDENGFCPKALNTLTGQERQDVVLRIQTFNKKFNPAGARDPSKVEDLFKYQWTEDEVMRKLMLKYAPEELKQLKNNTAADSAASTVDVAGTNDVPEVVSSSSPPEQQQTTTEAPAVVEIEAEGGSRRGAPATENADAEDEPTVAAVAASTVTSVATSPETDPASRTAVLDDEGEEEERDEGVSPPLPQGGEDTVSGTTRGAPGNSETTLEFEL